VTGALRTAAVIVLGVAVVAARSLRGLVSSALGSRGGGTPEPRHNEGRVREQVKAAQRAARAAGVLRR